MWHGKKVSVVLGGGGIKGLAHIGVLKAIEDLGIEPDEYIGTSIGSLVAALTAGGMPARKIEEIALSMKKEDIIDPNWLGVIWKRRAALSLLRGRALQHFIRKILPVDSFDELKKPLFMLATNLSRGEEVIWGMPGFREVPIHEAVVASCSLPGIFPPKKILGYQFVDGSVSDTLPIKIAVYHDAEIIIGVYLETLDPVRKDPPARGIAAVLMQAQTINSRTLIKHNLRHFSDAPTVLIHPSVARHGMFAVENLKKLIDEGERAAREVLTNHDLLPELRDAHPRPPDSP